MKGSGWIILMVLFLFNGCAHRQMTELNEANSLVFGYIDMDDSPAKELEAFTLKQVLPKTDKPYWNMRTYEGVFYMENMPNGSYQLNQFGGPGGFFSSASYYWFNFPTQADGFRVTKPGLYYLGSFKYKKAGSFWNPKFDIEPIESPGEREAIEKILQYSKGTGWEGMLLKRYQKLGGKKQ